jgi:transposase
VINAIRAHLAEFGVTAAVGRKGIEELLRVIADPSDKWVPDVVRACLAALGSQLLSHHCLSPPYALIGFA